MTEFDHLLVKSTVRLADTKTAAGIIKKIVDSGVDKLQIVTDFDYTISKSKKSDGTNNCTTHGIFDAATNGIDPDLQKELRALRELYYPIEMDPSLLPDAKRSHMEQWWKLAHKLIIEAGFKKEPLEQYVSRANVELRDRSLEFLRAAEAAGVPVVIFSAGIGNMIEIILKQQYGGFPKNAHLISNMMKFDDEDTVIDFQPPLIHTFNKNTSVIQAELPFFQQLKDRPNVILMGDTIGDLTMDAGVADFEKTILKIGFLNQRFKESLPAYLTGGYQIVLEDDQTFDVPLGILRAILDNKNSA